MGGSVDRVPLIAVAFASLGIDHPGFDSDTGHPQSSNMFNERLDSVPVSRYVYSWPP